MAETNEQRVSKKWPSESQRPRLDPSNLRSDYYYARLNQAESFSKEEAAELRLHLFPALASSLLLGEDYRPGVGTWTGDPALRTFLLGVRDESSPLSVFRDLDDTVVRLVYAHIVPERSNHVVRTIPAHCVGKVSHFDHGRGRREMIIRFPQGRPEDDFNDQRSHEILRNVADTDRGIVAFAKCGIIKFPKDDEKERNVNMMPFVIGDVESLPDDLRPYHSLIEACPYDDEEMGKVGYLTVHESRVSANEAQRRTGLHVETPGTIAHRDGDDGCRFSPAIEHYWGRGRLMGVDRFVGGIYAASDVGGTSRLYDALVASVRGVDGHGGCESLREYLGPGTMLRANELVWMTDRTPHEALPQPEAGRRRFFRFVTSRVSHWFADHSTPNPKVPLPNDVIVVRGNKFEMLR